jgi:hypothetical protein
MRVPFLRQLILKFKSLFNQDSHLILIYFLGEIVILVDGLLQDDCWDLRVRERPNARYTRWDETKVYLEIVEVKQDLCKQPKGYVIRSIYICCCLGRLSWWHLGPKREYIYIYKPLWTMFAPTPNPPRHHRHT